MKEEGLQEEQTLMLEHLFGLSAMHCLDGILVRVCWGYQKSYCRRCSTRSLIQLIDQSWKMQKVADLDSTGIES